MNGKVCGGCAFWSKAQSFKAASEQPSRGSSEAAWACPTMLTPRCLQLSQGSQLHDEGSPPTQRQAMNTIIYIVGLIVIIGVILSYFGFR